MSAKPIYQHFVNQAKKLNPRFLSMIIPSRWFSGGKGLDLFREEMLSDARIRSLVDYENFRDVFPGVDLAGGACYFLWDRDNPGKCMVTNHANGQSISVERTLNEFPVFLRQNLAVSIVRKVQTVHKGTYLDAIVSSRKPFGIPTNYEPKESGIPCYYIQRIGLKYADPSDVIDSKQLLSKWKLLVPHVPIAGQTDFSRPVGFYYDGNVRIAPPGTCCTESYIVAGAFETEEETLSYKSYLFTKVSRFLLLQTVVSQHVSKKNFFFVPDLGQYIGTYTDSNLCQMWGINDDEWHFIDSKISSLGGESDG